MSIQSSINQAVNGMMSMIMPMSLLKEQGKVKQLKAEQEALKTSNDELMTSNEELMASNEGLKTSNDELKTSNEGLKTSNDELKTSNDELTKRNDEELEKWKEISERSPILNALDFLPYLENPYSVRDKMADAAATLRVYAEQEKKKATMERLQKAFQNIGMGGGNV